MSSKEKDDISVKAVEELLKDEKLPELNEKRSLPLIDVEAYREREKNLPGGIERRKFSRAEVAERQLELKFSSGGQFARQYIENISLGGLFVRTTAKHPLGTIIPIEFRIPLRGEEQLFELTGKVCRVTDHGLGLEFIDLTDEIRAQLEEFVLENLPAGASVRNSPRVQSLQHLEEVRKEKKEAQEKRKALQLRLLAIVILLILNAILIGQGVQQNQQWQREKRQSFEWKGQTIEMRNVSSLSLEKDFVVVETNQTRIRIPLSEARALFPAHLRQSLDVLTATANHRAPRRSKNARGLVELK